MTKKVLKEARAFVKKNAKAFVDSHLENPKDRKGVAAVLIAMVKDVGPKGVEGLCPIPLEGLCDQPTSRMVDLVVKIAPTIGKGGKLCGGCWVSFERRDSQLRFSKCISAKKG